MDKKYNLDVVRVVNFKQACKYIQNGAKPVDIFYTDRLVFIFDKSATTDLFNRWRKYEL